MAIEPIIIIPSNQASAVDLDVYTVVKNNSLSKFIVLKSY